MSHNTSIPTNPALGSPTTTIFSRPSSSCLSGHSCAGPPNTSEFAGVGAGSAIAGLGILIGIAFLIRRCIDRQRVPKIFNGSQIKFQDSQSRSIEPRMSMGRLHEVCGERNEELEGVGFVEVQAKHRVEMEHQERMEMTR